MKAKAKPKATTGAAARLRAKGHVGVLIGIDKAEHQLIKDAAEIEKRTMRQFLIHHAVTAARKTISENA